MGKWEEILKDILYKLKDFIDLIETQVKKSVFWELIEKIIALNIFLFILLIVSIIVLLCDSSFNEFFLSLYDYNSISSFIEKYLNYIFTILVAYIVFLWFINHKKWLAILDDKTWSQFQIISLTFWWIEILLYAFLIKNLMLIEILIVFSIIRIIRLINKEISETYKNLIWNYEKLEEIRLEKVPKLVNDIISEFNITPKLVFFLSIIIFPIWASLWANLLSIIYIHIALIWLFTLTNLLRNNLPTYVNLYYKNKIFKWYITDWTKWNMILITKGKKYLFEKDKIEYIEVKN